MTDFEMSAGYRTISKQNGVAMIFAERDETMETWHIPRLRSMLRMRIRSLHEV